MNTTFVTTNRGGDTNMSETLTQAVVDPAQDRHRIVSALSSVVTYMITDAFDLNPEENLWVAHHINSILAPLQKLNAETIPITVNQELATNEYSDRLMHRMTLSTPSGVGFHERSQDAPVKYAPVSYWVEDISNVVIQGYPHLRPMTRSSIVGSIHGLLLELGVSDDKKKSRASKYLPASLRNLMNQEDF